MTVVLSLIRFFAGHCVRHLHATAFVGKLVDVEDTGFFRNVSAERAKGRLSISFTTPPFNFGEHEADLTWAGYSGIIATQRVMWARGVADGDDCDKPHSYGYHDNDRGLIWPGFSTLDEAHRVPMFPLPLTASCL